MITDKSWSKCLHAGKECDMSERGCDGMFAEGIDCTKKGKAKPCEAEVYGKGWLAGYDVARKAALGLGVDIEKWKRVKPLVKMCGGSPR